MQEEGNTKGWKIEGGKEGKTRKGKVGKSQRLRLWTKHNPSAAMHHLLCWARSVFFKMSAVISSGIIRLSDRAPDAFRGKALRQHTLVAHLSTNTHTHTRFVRRWNNMRQKLMRWGYVRTATVLQFSTNAELMGGGSEKKGLGRKTLKTNTP